jgi:hypothetical protein
MTNRTNDGRGETVTNAEHAAALLDEADAAMRRRRALLCAVTVLGTTNSVGAARRALTEWDSGPLVVRDDAIAILDALNRSKP